MKRTLSFFTVLILCSIILPFVSADGSIHIYDRDRWDLATEKQQFCAINYKDGLQHMILTVDPGDELKGEKAVWIFPVPAKPEKTVIDIMKGFPALEGYDVEERASSSVSGVFGVMQATQVYTIPILVVRMAFDRIGGTKGSAEGVEVYESIQKMGLTTELVSTEDGSSFADYIASKGLELTESSKLIFDEYIGKDYSFVVSWISDIEQFTKEKNETGRMSGYRMSKNAIGVYVTFPTERIYYPLKPTSVYGSEKVPAVIYVLDYAEPELYPEIKADTETNYFFASRIVARGELINFFAGYEKGPIRTERVAQNITQEYSIVQDVKYTKIKLNSPSKYLTQDLWIDVSTPPRIKAADIANRFAWVYGLVIFAVLSCLASLISGVIIFRRDYPSKAKFILVGLLNFLTLVGLSILTYTLNVRQCCTNSVQISEKRASIGKILGKTTLISLIAPIVVIIIEIIFTANRIKMFPNIIDHLIRDSIIQGSIIIVPAYLFLGLFTAPIIWGYYNDRKTMKFNFLFTAVFLALTIACQLIVKLVF